MAISKIILNGVTQMDVTQDTVAANNLLNGYTATGADGAPVVGAYVPASPTLQTVTKSYTPTESQQTETVSADTGYDAIDEVSITVGAISSTYVGSGITQRTSSDLSASGATVTAPSGYYASAATKTISSGSATPAASISGTAATVTTGTNTLTLSKTVSNTPQVSAGYVSSGTAGNSSVSLTANVTTKAAATITPGTSNQTIASGTYLTGAQTISGDANLVAGNIKSGTTIFGVTGTYEGSNPVKTATGTFTGNGTRTIDVACDFEPDLVYVTSNPGTTASSGTVAFIIARDMMAASRYRNNSTTNSHYAVTPCVNLNTSGSSYSWRATYANSKVTLYSFSNNARALLTSGRTYTYKFVKWTT